MPNIVNCMLAVQVFSIAFSQVTIAQENKVQEIYMEGPSLHKALVDLPDGYDPDKRYDLIIYLPARGGTAEEEIKTWDSISRKDSFIFVTLQAPYPILIPNGNLGFEWYISQTSDTILLERFINSSVEVTSNLAIDLRSIYSIGDIYLLGFSQGGAQAFFTGFSHPELFSGIMSFSAGIEEQLFKPGIIRGASGMPVFLAVGKNEIWGRNNVYNKVLESGSLLEDRGFDVMLIEFEGGHEMPEEVLEQALDWMLEKK